MISLAFRRRCIPSKKLEQRVRLVIGATSALRHGLRLRASIMFIMFLALFESFITTDSSAIFIWDVALFNSCAKNPLTLHQVGSVLKSGRPSSSSN